MTTKIIYHQIKQGVDCPDGYTAAWAAHKANPDAEIIGCWYQCEEEDLPTVAEGDHLIIVDFSFPSAIIQNWMQMGAKILLIDHHKTALEHLGFLGAENFSETIKSQYIFDMTKSGAVLTWEHFFPEEPVPLFLKYVQDRDLWNKQLPDSDAIHTVIGKLERTFELFDLLVNYQDTASLFTVLGALGNVLLAPKRKAIAQIVLRAQEACIAGYDSIPFVELSASEDYLVSDICEELYTNLFPEALFVACLTSEGTMSLRSNKNHIEGGFDVSAVAKIKGGGGHRNAAGYKVQEDDRP